MAQSIDELKDTILFSNSDAHSLLNIAREYNQLELKENSFWGLKTMLDNKGGRLIANFGLPPEMGKYYRSYCLSCSTTAAKEPPVSRCPQCGSDNLVSGVLDRLVSIADKPVKRGENSKYIYHVPLCYLPGIGPKKYSLLVERLGSEMAVYHEAGFEELADLAGEKIASTICRARRGELRYLPGGGGIYGKILDIDL